MSCGVWRRLLENWKRTVCATKGTEIKLPPVTIKPRRKVDSFAPALSALGLPIYVAPLPAGSIQYFCHDTLDVVSVPGYPSAILAFALTHSRRNVVQR